MGDSISWKVCNTEFWNSSLSWHTDRPQLSACFRDTALVWLPSALILLVLISESSNVSRARSQGIKSIQWNGYNMTRSALTLILVAVKCLETGAHLHEILSPSSDVSVLVLSSLMAPIIQATCYLLLFIVYWHQRAAGLHTSGSVSLYLVVANTCNLIDFCASISIQSSSISHPIDWTVKRMHLLLLVALFILECRGDSPTPGSKQTSYTDSSDERPECPSVRASFVSRVFFWWMNGFIIEGHRTALKMNRLWKTLESDMARPLAERFLNHWTQAGLPKAGHTPIRGMELYQLSSGRRQRRCNIINILMSILWPRWLATCCLKLLNDLLQFAGPLLLGQLIRFMDSDEPLWHGAIYALSIFLLATGQSIFLGNYFIRVLMIGVNIKSIVCASIYRKTLKLSSSSRLQSTSGEIMNLMAVDSHRFQDLILWINVCWSAPIQVIISIYLLYIRLGWSIFVGVVAMCIILPLNISFGKNMNRAQMKLAKIKDKRIKQLNELLCGIKVVKLYAWENSFMNRIGSLRDKELRELRKFFNNEAYENFIWDFAPFIVSSVTFLVYLLSDPSHVLNAEVTFVSLSIFGLLRAPLLKIPIAISHLLMVRTSVNRVNKFLNSDEQVKYVTRNDELEAIRIEGANMSWSEELTENSDIRGDPAARNAKLVLKDIDFTVKQGSFVAIVGQVASGKSSLLAAIQGEMDRISGRFNVARGLRLAYVPQQAWIQNMTVRENILFGAPLDMDRYNRVLDACSLRSDLETLPGGDQAEIGEKGINLSGGQKQRVSLARACYSQSDVFLMDDPFSALDSHVAKHVFEEVLSSTTGLLAGTTRVLATNSLFVLPYADFIYVLHQGRIVEQGSYQSLMKLTEGRLSQSMRQHAGNDTPNDMLLAQATHAAPTETICRPLKSVISLDQMKSSSLKDGKLIEGENEETERVDYRVYLGYFRSFSFKWLTILGVIILLVHTFDLAMNWWLSRWADDSKDGGRSDDEALRNIRLAVYGGLGIAQAVCSLLAGLSLTQGTVRASREMHNKLLTGVMHSPMSFFDTTPMGRIVNRFSKDIDTIDINIPETIFYMGDYLVEIFTILIFNCYSMPLLLVAVMPLSIAYYVMQKVFISTTRQLKRLESNSRSPIYSHLSETLSGLSSIKAFDCVDRFVAQADKLIDINQSCNYPNLMANRWLAMRLELFGNLLTLTVALLAVFNRDTLTAAVCGLVIYYSMSITSTLGWLVRQASDLETHAVCVERIHEYIGNKYEDDWIKDLRPPQEWPSSGLVSFEGYSTRYREDTELILRDLNIQVEAREKIGVVGRTGSGKTSLSLSLFRILEPASGRITIDGHDLSQYGLHDIRSKLTIIPQDPVLFSGSLRFNLDPLATHGDDELWRALELASLKEQIVSLGEGLELKVQEFGENFSVGQRQLICLARAILRKSRILVLDEATASIDIATDALVQRTIRDNFADCTIITIAHRLQTILDSDRILVLASGQVRELDKPIRLVERQDSEFASLVRDAGIELSTVGRLARD